MNKELLQLAYDRFQNKNQFNDKDYELSIEEFIVKMYLNCDPASYGRQFVKKIMRDCLSSRQNAEYLKGIWERQDRAGEVFNEQADIRIRYER